MRTSTSTALLVAATLGLSTLGLSTSSAFAQAGDAGERFGQMKPQGHEQAGDTTTTRMSARGRDDGSSWRGRDEDETASIDDDDDESGEGYHRSVGYDGHGWDRDRNERSSSWAREGNRDDRWRQHMRQEWRERMRERASARGMGPGGGMGPRAGAIFNVQLGDARVTVRCAAREEMSACVDAAVSLVNRLRQGATASTSSGSSSASPSTSPGAANPAPAPSAPKPTTP